MANASAIAIRHTGLVTSVGLSAPTSCAAIRAKVTNPSETRFIDSAGESIMAHEVPLEKPWRGLAKLARMAAMAIDECLTGIPREHWSAIPLLLCVAERDRPGRLEGLEDRLFREVEQALGRSFATESGIIAHGRVSAAVALLQARRLIHERNISRVLIAATDSLLTWPTLSHYERSERLLTKRNSNGFMPGEGAGAILLTRPGATPELRCTGIAFGTEKAHIDSGQPLRGDGLTTAIKDALGDAGCQLHDLDLRITDLSGEQYYFKEAALALSRVLRQRKEDFQLWHPAECVGELGAAAGIACLSMACAAGAKGFAPGSGTMLHMASDNGARAAVVTYSG